MISRRSALTWGLGAAATARMPRGWSEPAEIGDALGPARAGSRTMTSGRIERDIRAWDAIPLHRTGTAGDAATTDWLAGEIEAAGAVPEISPFPFARRAPGRCTVSDGIRRCTGLPLFDGGVTPASGVSGVAGHLGSGATVGVTPFGPSPRHPGSRALLDARRSGGHQAIVAYAAGSDGLRPGFAVLNAEHYTAPFGPPVLQVPMEARHWLEAAIAGNRSLTVHVELENEEASASNVQTRIEGRRPGMPPLVIMTPKSAWWTCTAERAGGITVWLNAIRHFASNRPDRTAIFTANTGHELGHVGLDRFLGSRGTLIQDARAWIHLGANFAALDGAVLYQASSDALMRQGLMVLGEAGFEPETTPVGQRPLGEARNIHDGGGSYVSLLGANPWFHQPDDRWPASVDLAKTVRLNDAVLRLADTLARA